MGEWRIYKADREESDLIDMMRCQKRQHLETIRDLKARVEELEQEVVDHAKWARTLTDDPSSEPYRKLLTENQRLREAAEAAMRKCEQYWNEHNIPDAEIHNTLEAIHLAMTAALKEKP